MKNNINTEQPLWLSQVINQSKQLPHCGDFNIQGLKIKIHCHDPEVHNWIEKYLYPLDRSNSLDTQAEYSVNMFHSDDLVLSALRSIEDSEVDTHRVSNARRYLERITVNEHITVDCDPAYGMLWITDNSSKAITLVLSVKVRWPLLEISRVVRDLITRFLEAQGWVIFHAGAIQTDNKNYMIIGDAGAGKTSLIIALLVSGATFISNERVFAKVVGEKLRLLSFPMPIAVGLGTMVQYPELVKFIRQPQFCQYPPRRMDIWKIHNTPERRWPDLEDKAQFLPQELTTLFSDASAVPGGIIHGIIVPSLQKNSAVELVPLKQERIKRIIDNNCIDRSRDDVYPPWMPLPFQRPANEDVNSIISQLADIPSFKFKFCANKNRRNEIATYSKRLQESFDSLGAKNINSV